MTRSFARWAQKVAIPRSALVKAVVEMECGLIDASLGGGLMKKRIAVGARGKSGGVRVIAASSMKGRWFFLFGFKKNEQESLKRDELKALQEIGADLLKLSSAKIEEAINIGALKEVFV